MNIKNFIPLILFFSITVISCNLYRVQRVHLDEVLASSGGGIVIPSQLKSYEYLELGIRHEKSEESWIAIMDTIKHTVVLPKHMPLSSAHILRFNGDIDVKRTTYGLLSIPSGDTSRSVVYLDTNGDFDFRDETSISFSNEKKAFPTPVSNKGKTLLHLKIVNNRDMPDSRIVPNPADFYLVVSPTIRVGTLLKGKTSVKLGYLDNDRNEVIEQNDTIYINSSTENDMFFVLPHAERDIDKGKGLSKLNTMGRSNNARLVSERQFYFDGHYYRVDTFSREGTYLDVRRLRKKEVDLSKRIFYRDFSSFVFKDMEGNEKTLKDMNITEDYTLISFWGTWCRPCLDYMPYYKKMAEKHKGKVRFITANYADQDIPKIKRAIKHFEMDWENIIVEDDFLKQARYSPFPYAILLDKDLKVIRYNAYWYGIDASLSKGEPIVVE